MASTIGYLKSKNIGNQPKWLSNNMVYEVLMGSQAYGTNQDDADWDIYGVCVPPKNMVFPHLSGYIHNFGKSPETFNSYVEHHLVCKERNRMYDLSVLSIVSYLDLAMANNPNIIDSLFVPDHCVLFTSTIGQMITDNRKRFLHKGAKSKFTGYAKSQWNKMMTKDHSNNKKRQEDIEAIGYSTKYAAHLVRLILECEQLLTTGDIILNRDRELIKSIRRREWTLKELTDWKEEKTTQMEVWYAKSELPEKPDEKFVKQLLIDCLEHHYGSLDNAVKLDIEPEMILSEMQNLIDKFKAKI